MANLTSVFGNQPSTLDAPVPGQQQQDDFISQMLQIKTPQVEDRAHVPPNDPQPSAAGAFDPEAAVAALPDFDAESLVAGLPDLPGAEEAAPQEEAVPQDPNAAEPTVPTESFEQRMDRGENPLEAIKNIVSDSIARAYTSFGTNTFETQKAAENYYGKKNVRVVDDKVQIKREGERGFRDLDPNLLAEGGGDREFFNDLVMDNVRLGLEVGVDTAVRAGGALAGGALGTLAGPGAVAAVPGGAVTGAVLSGGAAAASALTVGDFIAENILKIPRDPARNADTERAIAAGIGSVFGGASTYIAKKIAAREAAKGVITPNEILKTAKELGEDVLSLEKQGIKLSQLDGKMTISPGQVAGDLSQAAQNLDQELASTGPVQDFFTQQGKNIAQGWDKLRSSILNLTGKTEGNLFQRAKVASKIGREVEGATIGSYRDMAMQLTKGTTRALPATQESLEQNLKQLGFSYSKVQDPVTQAFRTVVHPPIGEFDDVARRFPGANKESIQEYTRIIKDFGEEVLNGPKKKVSLGFKNFMKENPQYTNKGMALDAFKKTLQGAQERANLPGMMSLKRVDEYYKRMRNFIDRNIDVGGNEKLAQSMIGLKDGLRDDWTQLIGTELKAYGYDQTAVDGYQIALGNLNTHIKGQEALRNILKKNDLSASAFADNIFSKASGKDRVQQLKAVIKSQDPQLWDDLVSHKLDMMLSKSMPKGSQKINWTNLQAEFGKLRDGEILGEMIAPEQQKTLEAFLRVAAKTDKIPAFTGEAGKTSSAVVGTVRNLLVLAAPRTSTVAQAGAGQNLTKNVIAGIGKDKALAKWLAGEGLELSLQGISKGKANQIRNVIHPMLQDILRSAKPTVGRGIVEPVFRGGTPAGREQ